MESLTQAGLSAGYAVVGLALAVAVLVAAVVHRDQVKQHWTTGLALSAVVLLLSAPTHVVTALHLDVFAVLGDMDLPPPVIEDAAPSMGWAITAGVVVSALLGLCYRTLLVPVAHAADPDRPPFPLLTGHAGALGGWWLAVPAGLVLGVGFGGVAYLLGAEVPEAVQQQQSWLVGIDVHSWGYRLGVALPYAMAAAISEGLLFRGVLQRWLARWLGGVAAIALTALVWSAGHAGDTELLALNLPIFVLFGLLLGGLARRWSVEASLAAHLAFVVASNVMGI